ncbi:hypothetical protein ACIA74_21685 [Streptomyces sp. NPDC051658]|uniref:hypothetical protein n=1 Tax=Streptomyces sp. NPDC051658 TaxID=3365667 RepID=UPI00378F0488
MGGKGAFTRSADARLLDGRVEATISCAKDLPGPHDRAPGITVGAVLPREKARDVLVLPAGHPPATLADLPRHAGHAARPSGPTAHLEGGRHVGAVPPLDLYEVHTRPRDGREWPWHPDRVPDQLSVPQAWGCSSRSVCLMRHRVPCRPQA